MIAKIFERVKNKIGGAPAKRAEVKARAGREFLFPEPFFFPAPPERKISEISVGIFAEKSSDFIQETQPFRKVSASRLGGRIFKQFQTSQSFFARRAKAKRQFSAQKQLQLKCKTI